MVSNPGLGAHVRQTVQAYEESESLEVFYSSIILKDNSLISKLSKNYKSFKSRQLFEIPNIKIKRLLLPESLRLLSSKFFSNELTDKIWEWSEHIFDKWVSKSLKKDIDIFHCYEHASLESIQKASDLGVFSVYEQPSAHHQYVQKNVIDRLLRNEAYFFNNFKNLYDSELSKRRNMRRDNEINSANLILCNSSYVHNTLLYAGVPSNKILVHPLGFPDISSNEIKLKTNLKFIVSGNLSYLKGVHHILRVWKNNIEFFENHELVLIGSDTLSSEEWKDLPTNVIKKNRMNRSDYLVELARADVLILNTYSDGFGMVLSEAMSNGLAVIGTKNSAAPDIVEDNITGKIISIGDEDELLLAMQWMVKYPEDLLKMRVAAREYAKNHSWHNYRVTLVNEISKCFVAWKRDA